MNQRKRLKNGEITREDISEGKKRALERKIIKFPIYENSKGKFIHYCKYPWHEGAMFQERVDKLRESECENKEYNCLECKHYHKIYLPK